MNAGVSFYSIVGFLKGWLLILEKKYLLAVSKDSEIFQKYVEDSLKLVKLSVSNGGN
ncbi:hypothetical protein [Desulfurobacterium pacificum]|uniref:hypothetical protein n=1 Tax=Desulfurobacterium pacificum TaxID=240166 RepID=UPI0024B73121|nr:hypothetical protein [Desulfurobacterium pacificum]